MGKAWQQRFWSKVDRRSDSECWNWTAAKANGYGVMILNSRTTMAHRIAYELLVGQIPHGMCIDHLCRNRACVNPAHLEPVTNQENCQRGARGRMVTTCKNGHAYTSDNTVIRPDGRRSCKACRRKWNSNAYRGRDAAYWRQYRLERKSRG